jgi:hypothetical protein
MSMKWMSCSYHNLQHIASEKPSKSPTTATVTVTVQQISGWSHILMTPSHSSRCENTLYMYGVNMP